VSSRISVISVIFTIMNALDGRHTPVRDAIKISQTRSDLARDLHGRVLP
jgi:hypothetical protein